jgi:hypothetical protein
MLRLLAHGRMASCDSLKYEQHHRRAHRVKRVREIQQADHRGPSQCRCSVLLQPRHGCLDYQLEVFSIRSSSPSTVLHDVCVHDQEVTRRHGKHWNCTSELTLVVLVLRVISASTRSLVFSGEKTVLLNPWLMRRTSPTRLSDQKRGDDLFVLMFFFE